MRRALLLTVLCILTMQARAATYYVIVAGLGGEPDYVQRFTAAANDLDKIYKSAQGTVHVATLTGAQATAAQLRQTLDGIARDAKPEDDFALVLIGHGSFDGIEYKFNLVGLPPGASLWWTQPVPAAERCMRWNGRGGP
jgi:hypothetical protein